jgi:effector-binding domain-containing protein
MAEYQVMVKKVPDVGGLGVREKVDGPARIGELVADGFAGLAKVGAMVNGAPVAVYHDPEFSAECIDVEMVFPVPPWVKGPLTTPGGRTLEPRTVPGGEVAIIVHVGSYRTIGESYQILTDWMGEYGYRTSGPSRELYLSLPTDPSTPVTEVRQPVERVTG